MKSLTYILFLLLFTVTAFAQNKNEANKRAYISLDLKEVLNPGDTVKIILQHAPSYYRDAYEIVSGIVNKKSRINFNWIKLTKDSKISFSNSKIKFGLTNYRVEKGDSINVRVGIGSEGPVVLFTGKGHQKYIAKYTIDSIAKKWLADKNAANGATFEIGEPTVAQVKDTHRKSSDRLGRQLAGLEFFRDSIGKDAYALLKADLIGENYRGRIKSMRLAYLLSKFNDSVRYEIEKLHDLYTPMGETEQKIFPVSDMYIVAIYDSELMKIYLENPSNPDRGKKLYTLIKQKFTGETRNNLIVAHLLSKAIQQNSAFDEMITDALEVVKDANQQEVLTMQLGINKKGAQAFNFKLPDADNKYVSLSDYKGKVVLINYWSSTCGFCKQFDILLREKIIPAFKGNEDVKIISINLDPNINVWRKGMADAGLDKSVNVNLFSEGLAFEHPLIKYYRINSIPWLMLIDQDGKMYKSIVTRNADAIIKDINEALNHNN